ncbi:MAG: transglutaminase domain-containing protein [Bacteroidetes bacterium]|nr:MAG: transglutaminase domain-containing protein [Bacteroidota bacterium]
MKDLWRHYPDLSSAARSHLALYQAPTYFLEARHPGVRAFAGAQVAGARTPTEQAVRLYYAVRDGWLYNPYRLDLQPRALKASYIQGLSDGNCIAKAIILASAARALGIPARLGFADVRNHLGTARLEALLGTDVLAFHGYCELFLPEAGWVKATPAFNAGLCEKLGVAPLEFDGKTDSVFQAYDRAQGQFMTYLHDYGQFHDLPYESMMAAFQKHYPHFFVPGFVSPPGLELRFGAAIGMDRKRR